MNLNDANAAWENYTRELITNKTLDHIEIYQRFYPQEAVDYLTSFGTYILVPYYALVAYLLYKAIFRYRYLYRFLISVVVFGVAICFNFLVSGLNLMNLGYALGFGFNWGFLVALIGFLFTSFDSPPPKKDAR